MQDHAETELKNFVATGQLTRAERQLRRRISSSTELRSQQTLRSHLIHVHIKQSRFKEAYAEADRLDAGLSYKRIPFALVLLLAIAVSFIGRIQFFRLDQKLGNWLTKMLGVERSQVSFEVVDGVLWGVYWQDMRRALYANIFCVLLADDESSRLKSLAFLNYTLAYQGWSIVGLSGMNRVLATFENLGLRGEVRDLLVWLGVAYQMGARPKQCLETHRRLSVEFPDSEAFHQIISFASRLHMSATELGPVETAAALEQSFSGSFALKESRNHIQIFGTKAAILALEGRREEALSFVKKAEITALTNENRLDNAIFHRFAAITYLNLREPVLAEKHISDARKSLDFYASIALYRHELARLTAIAAFQQKPTFINRLVQIAKFGCRAALIPNLVMAGKSVRIAWQFMLQSEFSYWPPNESNLYLRDRLHSLTRIDQNVIAEKISMNLTRALQKLDIAKLEEIGDPDLIKLVQEIFPTAQVLVSESLDECLSQVRENFGLSKSFIQNDDGDNLRAHCGDGRYLIAVRASLSAGLTVGVLVADVNVISHEMIESSLRIALTLYQSLLMSFSARQERLANQHQAHIAVLAAQVAHDIRSPLSALTMLVSFTPELSDEKRKLVRDASRRINDIANHLLKKSKEKSGVVPIASGPIATEVLLPPLIDNIVSEKRNSLTTPGTVEILSPAEYPFGLFSRLDQTEFQRALSNVLNNSVEALGEGGKVSIELRTDEKWISVDVIDNGTGMTSENLAKVGQRGFTSGKSGETSGHGLGLHHARTTMEAISGRLEISSQIGIGTKVRLSMPRCSPARWFASEIDLRCHDAVWIVDDDQSIHSVWKRRFAELAAGFPVVYFFSAREFLKQMKSLGEQFKTVKVLMDCDFRDEQLNGMELIIQHGLHSNSTLVSSRGDDEAFLKTAVENQVRVLPKSEMHRVPVIDR